MDSLSLKMYVFTPVTTNLVGGSLLAKTSVHLKTLSAVEMRSRASPQPIVRAGGLLHDLNPPSLRE